MSENRDLRLNRDDETQIERLFIDLGIGLEEDRRRIVMEALERSSAPLQLRFGLTHQTESTTPGLGANTQAMILRG